MESLRPRKGKELPKVIVPNSGSKVDRKAVMSIFLRLRPVKPRTGHPKSVYRRS